MGTHQALVTLIHVEFGNACINGECMMNIWGIHRRCRIGSKVIRRINLMVVNVAALRGSRAGSVTLELVIVVLCSSFHFCILIISKSTAKSFQVQISRSFDIAEFRQGLNSVFKHGTFDSTSKMVGKGMVQTNLLFPMRNKSM